MKMTSLLRYPHHYNLA